MHLFKPTEKTKYANFHYRVNNELNSYNMKAPSKENDTTTNKLKQSYQFSNTVKKKQ